MAQDFIENIFTEIEIQCLNTTKNATIGLIYIVPDSDTFFFNQEQSDIKENTKENKFIKLMTDYYTDILKCSKNEYIQEFLDIVMQITLFLISLIQIDIKQGH